MEFAELEQQRLTLEASLERLRQSLKHWQTWEAEYEGLKEELAFATTELTANSLAKIAKQYSGGLVNEKEILDLAGLSKGDPRTAKQIIGLIERRQDYVKKNIETVQRQYFDAEAKSEELAFAVAGHAEGGEGGLPLTEIHEELDEDGNVISSALMRPEESTSQMIESLKKAGLKDADLQQETPLKPAITNATPPMVQAQIATIPTKRSLSESSAVADDATHDDHDLERPSIRKKSVSFTADTKEAVQQQRPESEDGHKRVSFNDKVAVMPAAPPPDPRSVSFSPKVEEIPSQPMGPASPDVRPMVEKTDVQKDLRERFKPGERVAELNDNDEIEKIHVVMPEGESEEDARTRREMLEYHLNEVGNVVAQIDLEEAKASTDAYGDEDDEDSMSFHTSSEYLDDDDTPYTTGISDSEDEEDEYGRSIKPQITDEYRKRMEELQERLIGNLGPGPKDEDLEDVDPDLDAKDVKRLVIRDKRNSTSSMSSESSDKKVTGKKRVSFAENLDVAEPGSPPLKAQKTLENEKVAPVADLVAERKTSTVLDSGQWDQGSPQWTTSARQPGELSSRRELLAKTLVERTPAPRAANPPDEDEDDATVQRRQLADHYYRQRNQMIRDQGGFNKVEGEEDMMEEVDGKVKRVSRFKAARLRPAGGDGG